MLRVTGFDSLDATTALSALPIASSVTLSAPVAAGVESRDAGLDAAVSSVTTLSPASLSLVNAMANTSAKETLSKSIAFAAANNTSDMPSPDEALKAADDIFSAVLGQSDYDKEASKANGELDDMRVAQLRDHLSRLEKSGELSKFLSSPLGISMLMLGMFAVGAHGRYQPYRPEDYPEPERSGCWQDLSPPRRLAMNLLYTCLDRGAYPTRRRTDEIRNAVSLLWPGACRSVKVAPNEIGGRHPECYGRLNTCDTSDYAFRTYFKTLHPQCSLVHNGKVSFSTCLPDQGECRSLVFDPKKDFRTPLEREVMYREHYSKPYICELCECDDTTGRMDCDAGIANLNEQLASKCEETGATDCPGNQTAEDVVRRMDIEGGVRFWFDWDKHDATFKDQKIYWEGDPLPTDTDEPRQPVRIERVDSFDVTAMEPGAASCGREPMDIRYKKQFYRMCIEGQRRLVAVRRIEEIKQLLREMWPEECEVFLHHLNENYGYRGMETLPGIGTLASLEPIRLRDKTTTDEAERLAALFDNTEAIIKPDQGKVVFGACDKSNDNCLPLELRADELYRTVVEKQVMYEGLKQSAACEAFDCNDATGRVNTTRAMQQVNDAVARLYSDGAKSVFAPTTPLEVLGFLDDQEPSVVMFHTKLEASDPTLSGRPLPYDQYEKLMLRRDDVSTSELSTPHTTLMTTDNSTTPGISTTDETQLSTLMTDELAANGTDYVNSTQMAMNVTGVRPAHLVDGSHAAEAIGPVVHSVDQEQVGGFSASSIGAIALAGVAMLGVGIFGYMRRLRARNSAAKDLAEQREAADVASYSPVMSDA